MCRAVADGEEEPTVWPDPDVELKKGSSKRAIGKAAYQIDTLAHQIRYAAEPSRSGKSDDS